MASTRKPGCADFGAADASGPFEAPDILVRNFLACRLPPGGGVCLGLSGGLDSTVLLHILADLRAGLDFRLSAAHVHHGLSPHADAWAEHCRSLCLELKVPLAVERVSVLPAGKGIEAAARAARYEAFARQTADFLVLAHHLDDQVETFFLRLLRGAGALGLGGMSEDTAWRGRRILRPLLGASRAAIQAFAASHDIAYVEDESNLDTTPTRNFLRHALSPVLAERFPGYRRTIARDMARLRESAGLLLEMAWEDLARMPEAEHPDIPALIGLGASRGKNLLRCWLAERIGVTPGSAQLAELWRQLASARADGELCWRIEGGQVRRYRDRLYALTEAGARPPAALSWRGEASLEWGGAGRLEFELVPGQGVARSLLRDFDCEIRSRRGGERFQGHCRRPAKTVKKWLREAGVPPWTRDELPMLFVGDELAWVAGLGVACRFQAGPDEPGWVISWRPRP